MEKLTRLRVLFVDTLFVVVVVEAMSYDKTYEWVMGDALEPVIKKYNEYLATDKGIAKAKRAYQKYVKEQEQAQPVPVLFYWTKCGYCQSQVKSEKPWNGVDAPTEMYDHWDWCTGRGSCQDCGKEMFILDSRMVGTTVGETDDDCEDGPPAPMCRECWAFAGFDGDFK